MNITILGAGAWGTALAISLAERHNVVLWGRNKSVMQEIAAKRWRWKGGTMKALVYNGPGHR